MSDSRADNHGKHVLPVLMKSVHETRALLTLFVHNRSAFLALVSVVAFLKLLFCAVAPDYEWRRLFSRKDCRGNRLLKFSSLDKRANAKHGWP